MLIFPWAFSCKFEKNNYYLFNYSPIVIMQQEHIFISAETGLDETRRNNLHLTVGLLSFATMVFHFTAVYFFTLQLESLALVGIFLGLGNFFAFLFDVPIGILQYYFKSKTLFLFWVISQIIAMLIFANFIFEATNYIAETITAKAGIFESVLSFFLNDIVNLILLLVAALCYGFTKEINDITTISYVMNQATPDQYKTIISKNNLYFWIGSFLWLLLAGGIMNFSPKFIIFQVVFLILLVFFITSYYFDNKWATPSLKDIEQFKVYLSKNRLKKMSENVKYSMNIVELKKFVAKGSYIFLKPMKMSENRLDMETLMQKTQENLKDIFQTLLYASEKYLIVFWSCVMVLTFGFWDTFASTFLIDFLNQLKPGWSYILLGIIAIPAFWLQDFFGKIADKSGIFMISCVGLSLSAGSLLGISFLGSEGNIFLVVGCALMNSVGYAICMSISVATFLESYNKAYAERKQLKEIDANASAAPMKILQNLANVVGLFLGGMIVSFFGYQGFFFGFGMLILWFLVWSLFKTSVIQ